MSKNANKPRCTPTQTRNGKNRIKGLTVTQLATLLDKTQSNRTKNVIRNRILVLECRIRKCANTVTSFISVLEKQEPSVTVG